MRAGHLLACLLVCSIVSPVMATFTTINPPASGEDSQKQILNKTYNDTFSQSGLNYTTNDGITATRVEDVFDSSKTPNATAPLSITGDVGNDDQVWLANYKSATAEAIFAAFNQQFGYILGDGSNGSGTGSYVNLFNDTGSGYNVTGAANLGALSGKTLRWARGGQSRVVSSKNSDNADGMDHMVTYRIDGLDDSSSGVVTWLIFFEDKFKSENADFDFQDLAIQIKATPLTTSPVPEPASLSLVLCGLLGLSRRRK
jgi:hypothetical protein